MARTNAIVLALAGYTKSRKSTAARLLEQHAGFATLELSDAFRSRSPADISEPSLSALLSNMHALRAIEGPDALAATAVEQIRQRGYKRVTVAGLRSFADHRRLSEEFSAYHSIYLHTATGLRHDRLRRDPTSIARTDDDFRVLDALVTSEGIDRVAEACDYLVVNEPDYPLTLLAQLRAIVIDLAAVYPDLVWREAGPLNLKEITMTGRDSGVRLYALPVFKEEAPADAPDINRVIKAKGEIATLATGDLNYLAYVDFPMDGEPRANHYHEEKLEHLYLVKGRLQLHYRRGGAENAEVTTCEVAPGMLVVIEPGWAHAYVTLEEGMGIEFAPTPFEVVRRDKVRDYVVR